MVEQAGKVNEIQLVVFALASEYYGVDSADVREILRMQSITMVPGAPHFVEGVINLRGRVVPVVDLRKKLHIEVNEQTRENRIVVVDVAGQDVGVIVDAVTEVLRIPLSTVESPSAMITDSDSDYLRGIAKLEDKLIILLDLTKVLSATVSQGVLSVEQTGEKSLSTVLESESLSKANIRKKLASVSSAG